MIGKKSVRHLAMFSMASLPSTGGGPLLPHPGAAAKAISIGSAIPPSTTARPVEAMFKRFKNSPRRSRLEHKDKRKEESTRRRQVAALTLKVTSPGDPVQSFWPERRCLADREKSRRCGCRSAGRPTIRRFSTVRGGSASEATTSQPTSHSPRRVPPARQPPDLPEQLRRTMTLDNGQEFARHQLMTGRLALSVDFAKGSAALGV